MSIENGPVPNPLPQPDPYPAMLDYWSALQAPADSVARALRRDVAAVRADLQKRAESGGAPHLPIIGYPSRFAWPERTVTALIRSGLTAAPSQPSTSPIVTLAGEGALDRAELRTAVLRAAGALQDMGVTKGSRVAVDATQRIESLILAAATLLLGAVLVRLSLTTGAEGVRRMLQAARPLVCFTACTGQILAPQDLGTCFVALDADGPDRIRSDGPGRSDASGVSDWPRFSDWLARAQPEPVLPEVSVTPDDPALIGFTSGSTGQPKLVETSHLAVFRSSEAMVAMFGLGADDVFCTSTDFSALSAFRSMLTVPLLCGGRIVLPSRQGRTNPLALAQDCMAQGVTRLTAIPAVLRGLAVAAGRLPEGALQGLRTVFSGSGVLDQATHDAVRAGFGVPVIDYYGGREFATALYSDPASGQTVSSGGGFICNCLIRIVDAQGRQVPNGQIGEIMVHSDCLTSSDLAGSHPAWRGWHQSGDLGRLTEDGRVQIVGRLRDVIKAADGSLVFPAEIEALLNERPEVSESCVMGWMQPDGRERIIAAVRLLPPPEAPVLPPAEAETRLRSHVLARAGRFRVPDRIVVLTDFPRTGTVKIDRAALRRQLANDVSEG